MSGRRMREFTERERDTLQLLGDFGPTVAVQDCMIKGWMDTSKVYLDSTDLRNMAEDLESIAQGLDDRADQDTGER